MDWWQQIHPTFHKESPRKETQTHADVGEKKNVLQEIQTAHPAPLSTSFGVDESIHFENLFVLI